MAVNDSVAVEKLGLCGSEKRTAALLRGAVLKRTVLFAAHVVISVQLLARVLQETDSRDMR